VITRLASRMEFPSVHPDCLLIGVTIITRALSFTSNRQSSISPGLRLNCLTTLMGTVVLSEAFLLVAGVNTVVSPILTAAIFVNATFMNYNFEFFKSMCY